jgi:hypothetical protein
MILSCLAVALALGLLAWRSHHRAGLAVSVAVAGIAALVWATPPRATPSARGAAPWVYHGTAADGAWCCAVVYAADAGTARRVAERALARASDSGRVPLVTDAEVVELAARPVGAVVRIGP